MKILATGGCGFIGSNLVRLLLEQKGAAVVNMDKLTYAGNLASLVGVADHSDYFFERVDLCDAGAVQKVFQVHQPSAVMHLAAESHVDRSIHGPGEFIQTNIVGTYNLLQAALAYWQGLPDNESGAQSSEAESFSQHAGENRKSETLRKSDFRFLHVSTDEVYGSLAPDAPGFSESTPYDPHSPYSASKAASDHLARAWHDTFGLPVIVTNCSNNYGPFQFPEKLVPVVIIKCLRGEKIPVYGRGENIRDWLYVEDHAEALYTVLKKGRVGETYNIGGNNERKNIELVEMLCGLMDEMANDGEAGNGNKPMLQPIEPCVQTCEKAAQTSISVDQSLKSFKELITFVADRPGHDMRYAIDASKIRDELGWEPKEDFELGFRKTVRWYLENRTWWENILSGNYNLERLGSGSGSVV